MEDCQQAYATSLPIAPTMQEHMPDYATALDLMNFMAANMAGYTAAQSNAMPMGQPDMMATGAPWSPSSPQSGIVELEKELNKEMCVGGMKMVPAKRHLKAPYRRPTDDEIAERLQNITIKPVASTGVAVVPEYPTLYEQPSAMTVKVEKFR